MIEKILKALFLAGVLFLAYLGGIVSGINKTYFYQKIHEVYQYEGARSEQKKLTRNDRTQGHRFLLSRTQDSGVTVYERDKSFNGLTLYTDATPSAYLLDMEGDVVHQWNLPYDQAFPEKKRNVEHTLWHGIDLLPNGDLLAVYMSSNETPYGGGLVKIDKDSHVIWKYAADAHHDVDVAPDGTIYTIIQIIDKESLPGIEFIPPPFMHDYIVALSPDGKEIKRVSVLKALQNSQYAHLLHNLPLLKGDVTHVNSVRYITPQQTKVFPLAKAGELLISIPVIGALAVLDTAAEKITWLKQMTKFQHTVTLLNNGHIMYYDNSGGSAVVFGGRYSRVVEYDPIKDVIVWSYEGTMQSPMMSRRRGGVQWLPNGNVLITESQHGHLLEVTRAGEIVWEFYCPLRLGKKNEYISIVNSALRYEAKDLPFLTRDELEKNTMAGSGKP